MTANPSDALEGQALTERQLAFCKSIIAGMRPTQAYKSAGYRAKGARQSASRLMKSAKVCAHLKQLRGESDSGTLGEESALFGAVGATFAVDDSLLAARRLLEDLKSRQAMDHETSKRLTREYADEYLRDLRKIMERQTQLVRRRRRD